VLPVRDEERNVVPCVEALLGQTAKPAIRVVDDGSRDRTAELAAGLAAANDRVEVLAAGPLPEGWRGKLHALAVGMAPGDHPWLLFTDADTRHAPELLARAHAAAALHRLDLVSVAGRQETRGLGEALLTPAVFAVLDTLLGDWAAAATGAGPAVANGQFILVRRRAIEESRALEAVRGAFLDDIALAAELRRQGWRTGFWRAGDLLRVRMYQGLTATWRGWRRNLAGIYAGRGGAAAATLAILLGPALGVAAAAAARRWPELFLLWAGGAAASARLRSGSGHSPWPALLYPLDALATAGVLAAALIDLRRGR
jgi:chlorobactene glucosyltransferase